MVFFGCVYIMVYVFGRVYIMVSFFGRVYTMVHGGAAVNDCSEPNPSGTNWADAPLSANP